MRLPKGSWTKKRRQGAGRPGSIANPAVLSLTRSVDVRTFQAEMTIRVGADSVFFDGEMDVEAFGVEPDAAAVSDRFGFGDFAKAKQVGVEGAGEVFAAFGHGDVDVGESHGWKNVNRNPS